ncbi:hypothetical protein DAH66_16310 [Sphingomonas koreensis]|uniref:Uncharacterized protein n=1 Tax=Sphingomonas koreensis TaxID=93064 RepID=A0A430G0N5_9SPHN|nr:hypothetical protein DAH66_16310 [Sphingomonas koreensis]
MTRTLAQRSAPLPSLPWLDKDHFRDRFSGTVEIAIEPHRRAVDEPQDEVIPLSHHFRKFAARSRNLDPRCIFYGYRGILLLHEMSFDSSSFTRRDFDTLFHI